jgi:steroid delta-isomerase-like uncharacterized protein
MEELIKRHMAAFASSDWDTYRADLAPDAIYEEIATGARAEGIDEYVATVSSWKKVFPDAAATVKNTMALGDTLIAEVEWSGTQSGPLETPFGTLPPTNKSVRVGAVLISKIRDGKIAETRHYFDQLTILEQVNVGAFFAPTPQPEAAQPAVH